ncbi:hypothetical protein ACRE1U_01110 [Helicobacter himalayensis]|uniref:hypothetical protein n=1 Tax=Helicobacter himalayensis TaxID=1591088 RepID=UPI003D6E0212
MSHSKKPDKIQSQSAFEIYENLCEYFQTNKNPKIFMFFISLVKLSNAKQNTNIFFNILGMSYKFDVCEKTIKLWLKELERLELIKFNYTKKQLHFLSVLNHKESIPYKTLHTQESTDAALKELPTRFYKNIQQIMREISRKCAQQTLILDNEIWRLKNLSRKDKKMSKYKLILLELQNIQDSSFYTSLTYQQLTHKSLPPINNPYHLRIIKSNIKKSLELLSS